MIKQYAILGIGSLSLFSASLIGAAPYSQYVNYTSQSYVDSTYSDPVVESSTTYKMPSTPGYGDYNHDYYAFSNDQSNKQSKSPAPMMSSSNSDLKKIDYFNSEKFTFAQGNQQNSWNHILKELDRIKTEHMDLVSAIQDAKLKELKTQEALDKLSREDRATLEEHNRETAYSLLDEGELQKLKSSLEQLVERAKVLQTKKEILVKQKDTYVAEIGANTVRLNELVKENAEITKKIDKLLYDHNEELKLIKKAVESHKEELANLNSDQIAVNQLNTNEAFIRQTETFIIPTIDKPYKNKIADQDQKK